MRPEEHTLSPKRKYLKNLQGKQRLQYIWDYYKLPAVICLILIYMAGYAVHGHFSRKETLLYAGLVNISASEQLKDELSDGFIGHLDADISKKELELYTGLYLTDDPGDPNHEYTYASRIKIIAAVDDERLDVVLMNKEVFDAFSQSGYLCNMEELLSDLDYDTKLNITPYLAANTVILEDNADDLPPGRPADYKAVTEEYPMGLLVSQKGIFKKAGFGGDVYLGVVKNSPRTDMAIEYINYLYSEQ